ncbi:putative integrase [Brevibacillus phage Sundance]|uniref:integrase n=1 Tax=Brevibacillus phage Sundance TaxID=1691958 RepID=UPI0006BD36D9|nr:integrase [Brevibacillus phage Sundance]ALA47928.1 putative integrase [Brevibacillus phage Sundance]
MEAIYLNDWAKTNWGLALLKDDFQIRGDELKDVEILLASYTYDSCEGDAFVLFRKDGKLYEVNGSHCSCFGLEGQWKPDETNIEVLEHRLTQGALGIGGWHDEIDVFRSELIKVLNELKEGK